MDSLAIIIPAYKDSFLKNTLESIANQTEKNFNLYICNDNSPYDIDNIVDNFKRKYSIPLKYIKFKENLGGRDLVAHWERCVKQTANESLIWLFSDDDIIECNCVENLFKAVNKNPNIDVFHFNLSIINTNNNVIKFCTEFPELISSEKFFALLYEGKIDARMPEFVFRRKRYEECGGFIPFDLAWRSDNATVINLAANNGIITIPHSKVLWRLSDENISAHYDSSICKRKDASTINFFNWVNNYFINIGLKYVISTFKLELAYSSHLFKIRKIKSPLKILQISAEYNYNTNIYRKIMFIIATYYIKMRIIKNKLLNLK